MRPITTNATTAAAAIQRIWMVFMQLGGASAVPSLQRQARLHVRDRAPFIEDVRHLVRGDGPAEEIALRGVALAAAKEAQLFFRLHSLGDDLQPQTARD